MPWSLFHVTELIAAITEVIFSVNEYNIHEIDSKSLLVQLDPMQLHVQLKKIFISVHA